ncbi:hypothetical protein PINS_up023618 [Pythium insidiosum]|nr:hypothetical protein PINS_up023618 [Pythium insidiosum]
MYGSLRKGGIVTFFSTECIGLAAATFSSAFSYMCLQSVTRPYMGTQLNLTPQQRVSVQRLVELPMALSFFVGLLSDGYPILGLRRKSYMVVGLLLNALSVVALAGISMYFESLDSNERSSPLVVMAIVMISLASFGCITTYICVQTRVVELSQREPLRVRGAIIAEYLVFRRLTSLCSTLFSYATMGSTEVNPNVAFSTAMLVLAFISVLPLPIILRFWKEEHYNLPTSFKVRAQIFWKIMQQKAVWRTIAFIAFFALFLGVRFMDSANVIRNWAGAMTDNPQLVRTIQDAVVIVTILAWRSFFMNSLWRRFFCWAPLFLTLPNLLVSSLVAMDVERNRYVYRALVSVTNIADGITSLNPIVPLVEIIQEGSEGATVGLVLSLQRLISVFVNTNAQGLFRGSNFYDVAAVKRDTHAVRVDVLLSLVLNYGINLVALVGLFFLPSQKLDAQQLRMYGGFTKIASAFIVVLCVTLFVYSTTINVMTFVPALACYPLVGGKGCT